MSSEDRLILFENVSKFYGEVLGVNRVSLAIEPGITSLVGPNGAGKTTLMNLMAGLLRPTKGVIRVLGVWPSDPERFYRNIGYCTQFDSFPKGLNGYDLIHSMLGVHGYGQKEAENLTWTVIDRVGMRDAARRKIGGYSKGMRQRIKLALALAHQPRVLVLDEPLNGLDPMARAEVIELFRSFAESGLHVIISSHIMHEVDMISDRIVMMSTGYVVAEGDIQGVRGEMRDHPMQILIRCDQPSLVAARVFGQDSVVEVKIHADGRGLLVSTRNADQFYTLLNQIILDNNIAVEAVAPADENVHSVYQYLVGDGGDHVVNFNLWSKQIDAIVRLELKRYWRGRRWIGLYVMALAPVALLLLRAVAIQSIGSIGATALSEQYARFYQLLILRFGIFFSCAVVFSQLMRGEILEKTLHFYLLAPVHRGVTILGKYIAGVVVTIVLFELCTAGSFLLLYFPSDSFREFFMAGNGIPHLARYMAATMLACIGYGSVFLLTGSLFKNPAIPTAFLLGWESLNFAFPVTLQNLSFVHHIQSLLPVTIDRGIFAVLTGRTPAIIGVPGILIVTAGFLACAGWLLGRAEVTYSAD